MKKGLVCMVIFFIGILSIWIVNAETLISKPYWHIDYTLNENEPFEAQVITITDWIDIITILDRNLWAKKAWTGCEDPNWLNSCIWWDPTYWYHFQWGNNYGFNPMDDSIRTNAKSVATDWAIWSGIYDNSWYYGTIFITWDDDHWFDYWSGSTSSSSNYENLRWWGEDYNDANKWYGKNNENRHWPCPENFHVPSFGELQKLQNMLNVDGKRNKETLRNKLLIPFAGWRDAVKASVYNIGNDTSLWSSSPISASNSYSRDLKVDVDSSPDTVSDGRALALSVRCFYDSYDYFKSTVTYNLNWWFWTENGSMEPKQVTYTWLQAWATNRKTPNKSDCDWKKCMFDWRYLWTGNDAVKWTGYLDGDVNVYAKWLPFEDLRVVLDWKTFILMDRNLWATVTWAWPNAEVWSYGYHFQWGNNHWFESCHENGCNSFPSWEITWNQQIDVSWYEPSTYNNGLFVVWKSNWTTENNYENLRWWLGDGVNNWRWLSWNNLVTDRRWPCPEWYHVPSIWERNDLLIHRASLYTWEWNDLEISRDNYQLSYFINNIQATTRFYTDLYIPFTDYRYYTEGKIYEWFYFLWSSSTSFLLNLNEDHSLFLMDNFGNISDGYPVRCFSDSYLFVNSFSLKDGDKEVASWNIIYGDSLLDTIKFDELEMRKDGYRFDYRYSWWNDSIEFDLTTPIISDITLNAHWSPIEYNITYILDGGINSENNTWKYTIQTPNIILEDAKKDGYNFAWWFSNSDFTTWVSIITEWTTWDITLYAKWEIKNYNIEYILNGGSVSWENITWYTIQTDNITLINPTKSWYIFTWWSGTDLDSLVQTVVIPIWSTWDRKYEANWEEIWSSGWEEWWSSWWGWWSSWWGGWWGGWGTKKNSSNDKNSTSWAVEKSPEKMTHPSEKGSDYDITLSWTKVKNPISFTFENPSDKYQDWQYTQEFQNAYNFAYKNWITTMPTIQKAQIYGNLTRIAMAKMLSQYAINVLWQKPDKSMIIRFDDVSKDLDRDYDDWVTLAYQLWIMWINMPNNKFRPNDEVTRWEFATALSRMLYSTPDGKPYYITHLEKLRMEWILIKLNPEMKELRGYVMIMLMRSASSI